MSPGSRLLLGLAVLAVAAICMRTPTAAADADALQRYGRHLARECTGCHRSDTPESAIPALAGRPADEIIALLAACRAGRKTNPVMVSVARSLDADQSAALAAYFAGIPTADAATRR